MNMKFVLLSDMHLMQSTPEARKDDIISTQFRKLEFVLNYAKSHGCAILQAGDFFDKPRSWFLLPKVIDLLLLLDVEIYACFGQHDMYLYSETTNASTSLGVLEKSGLVSILGDKPIVVGDVHIYGASWGLDVPQVQDSGKVNILVTHRSIGCVPLFFGHEYTDALTFLQKHVDYDVILAGDIHRKTYVESGSRYFVNTGPLTRITAEQYNFKHTPGFFVFDVSKTPLIEWVDVPCEASDSVLSREHIEKANAIDSKLNEFIASVLDSGVVADDSLQETIQMLINEIDPGQTVIDVLSDVMGG